MHISIIILLASAVPINHTTVLDLACILLRPVDQEHPVYQRNCTNVSFCHPVLISGSVQVESVFGDSTVQTEPSLELYTNVAKLLYTMSAYWTADTV